MAKVIADPTGGVIVGIDMVHYAVLTEDTKDKAPEYDKVTELPNAKSIQVASNDSIHSESYDNAPKITAISKGEKKATFVKSDFSDKDMAAFLGCEIIDGVLVESGDASPPYIALGWRMETTKGHRYYWALKGMMMTPSINATTKEQGNLTFQNQTVEGTFIARNHDNGMIINEHVVGDEDTDEFAKEWFSEDTLIKTYKKAGVATGA